jgi:membrane-associated phospholipid phosphatase
LQEADHRPKRKINQMPLLKWLDKIDRDLFILIQHTVGNPSIDTFMLILRNPFTWIPLYFFILCFSIFKGKKKAWIFILLSILTFALTDSISARLLKPLFERPRPCHDAEIHALFKFLLDCGGLYSFPSSHASNHFGLAAFWYGSVQTMAKRKWHWLWIWALAICYAQVYVGKHYPFDIVGGAIFGFTTGFFMARIFEYWWNTPNFNPINFIHRQPINEKKPKTSSEGKANQKGEIN